MPGINTGSPVSSILRHNSVFLSPLNPVRKSRGALYVPHSVQRKMAAIGGPNTLFSTIFKAGREESHGSHRVMAPVVYGHLADMPYGVTEFHRGYLSCR